MIDNQTHSTQSQSSAMAATTGIGGLGGIKNAALPLPSPKKISIDVLSEEPTEEDVTSILQLSKAVFGVKDKDTSTHHSSLEEWQQRLSRPGAIVIRAALDVQRRDLQSKVSGTPVGFIFGYRKEQRLHDGAEVEAAHIWLAGVHNSYEGQGIFRDLMKVFEQYASENHSRLMSVTTYPTRFDRMYELLRRTGWKEISSDDGKVVLVKEVSKAA